MKTLLELLQKQAQELGLDGCELLPLEDGQHEAIDIAGEYLQKWTEKQYHADLEYMQKHGEKRWKPNQLIQGTCSIIAVRKNYLSPKILDNSIQVLKNEEQAYISRYALGRDYHKVLRKDLSQLSKWLEAQLKQLFEDETSAQPEFRVFVDSAPVMEKAIAEASGLGWIGKNTLLLNRNHGSWFFLGEIYTNVPPAVFLEPLSPADPLLGSQHSMIQKIQVANLDASTQKAFTHLRNTSSNQHEKEKAKQALKNKNHCGKCTECIQVCPTQAIVAPYQLDAKRCISYLTIENKNEIPIEFRKAIGNRIFGCDDCQLFCPWNRFAQITTEKDFSPRHGLDTAKLLDLFAWTAEEFDIKTQGSPIRRSGYQGWIRNIAVALGNAPTTEKIKQVLREKTQDHQLLPMVKEHVSWAIKQHS